MSCHVLLITLLSLFFSTSLFKINKKTDIWSFCWGTSWVRVNLLMHWLLLTRRFCHWIHASLFLPTCLLEKGVLRWITHSLPLLTFDVRIAFSSLTLLSCLTIWLTCCSLCFWQESWVMYSLLLLYSFLYHTLMYTCYTLPEYKSFFRVLRSVHHSTPPSDPKSYCTSSPHLWQLFMTGLQFLYTSVWRMPRVIRDNHDLVLIEREEGENLNCPVAFLSSRVEA